MRILLVDDDPAVRETFAKALAVGAYDVLVAGEGRMALRLMAEHPIDLLITDLHMPEVDGLELLRTMRRYRPDLALIAVSGGSERGYASPVVALTVAGHVGASRLLVKPFTVGDLLRAVREVTPVT